MRCEICGSKECCGGVMGKRIDLLETHLEVLIADIEYLSNTASLPAWLSEQLEGISSVAEAVLKNKGY